jgi:hypothetical protein
MAGYIGNKSSVTLVDGYSEAEADAEFVTKTGDTMTGNLNVTGTVTSDALTVDGIIRTINGTDIDMDGTASGQLKLDGNGYGGAIALNAQGMNVYTNSASRDIIFGTNETEVMRIDGSENVLIGKTSSSTTTAGFEAQGNGQTIIGRANGAVLKVNRLSSDGDIVSFRKDGTTVGSIGINGRLTIDGSSDGTGIYFGGGAWLPRDSGAIVDATVGLGGSTQRFTDLYLSGGVYLGGTGSANLLDGYEKGSWSPTIGLGSTTSTLSGKYVKVGDIVHFSMRAVYLTERSSSATISFTLPFAASSTTLGVNNLVSSVIRYVNLDTGFYGTHGIISNSGTTVNVNQDGDYKSNPGLRYDQLDSAYNSIVLHGSYYTA